MDRRLLAIAVVSQLALAACGSGSHPAPYSCAAPAIVDGGMVALQAPATTYTSGQCVLPIVAPVSAGSQALGQAKVGTTLYFTVPAGTSAVSIVSQVVAGTAPDHITYQGVDIPNSVVPTDVQSPDPAVRYDDLLVPAGVDPYPSAPIFYGSLSPADGVMTLPDTSFLLGRVASSGLPAGTWSFTVNDWAYECYVTGDPGCTSGSSNQGVYDVQVLTRPGGVPSRGTLDLAVYVVSQTWTASSLRTDPRFTRFVESIQGLLTPTGICLGTVTVFDVPSWARDRWWTIDVDKAGACDPLAQLFTLSQPLDAVHLFLADDLTSSANSSTQAVAGIDGTIPGPSGVPGGVGSGAAVAIGQDFQACQGAFDPVHCGSDFLAYVAAHETGHWLGLYHPTEAYGDAFDPLSDTATCLCSACAPVAERSACFANQNPTFVFGDSCLKSGSSCGGGRNLMFWIYQDGVSTGELTGQQAEVMRLNPAVH
ncbi:MAG TPA: hypothetical protein VLU43_17445 [Anaeromyxobacteraceae bacterium]|nr:hypothetical protein [Anaeromyxobacteraceae bacterium]